MSDEHEHIVKSFSEDLIQLKNMILKMAGLVENQLQLSLDSILKHDSKDCVKIIKSDNEDPCSPFISTDILDLDNKDSSF